MAKYNVTYKCGCEGEVQLVGKHADRDRKLAWLTTQQCRACESKAAAADAAAAGLPELTGSPKQIAWAISLRAERIAALDNMLSKVTSMSADAAAKWQQCRESVLAQAESRYWIDSRDIGLMQIMAAAAKELGLVAS